MGHTLLHVGPEQNIKPNLILVIGSETNVQEEMCLRLSLHYNKKIHLSRKRKRRKTTRGILDSKDCLSRHVASSTLLQTTLLRSSWINGEEEEEEEATAINGGRSGEEVSVHHGQAVPISPQVRVSLFDRLIGITPFCPNSPFTCSTC